MCSCDLDQPSVFDEVRRKARKSHKCDSCRGTIDPGEEYIATFGVWSGRASRYKRCLDCDGLLVWAHRQDDCLCVSVSDIMSDLRDHFCDRGEPALTAEFAARARAIKMKRCQPVAA